MVMVAVKVAQAAVAAASRSSYPWCSSSNDRLWAQQLKIDVSKSAEEEIRRATAETACFSGGGLS